MALQGLADYIKKMFGFQGEQEDPLPKYTFPDTMEGFGYHFNENGEMRDKDGGKFQFVIREKDHNYNQQRYDALGELVTEYLYDKMEKELQLERVYIPLDAKKGDPQSFIFLSRDALTTPDKLMLLIHGGGAVRAGQWSRKLIINENIETGSQLPYIQRAMADGYGVIVCNPNLNQVTINGKPHPIKGNKTPEEHGQYVWQHFVRPAKAKHVAIVAHSYGGIVTLNMIEKFLEEMKQRVFAICFTDSVHTMQRHLWTPPAKAFIKERAVNFGASYVPINIQLQVSDPDDCASVSAGTQEHERTSHMAIDLVFKFIKDNYATWSRDRTFAERHFLPLPEDLSPYQPSNKWNMHKKEAEAKMVDETEGEGANKRDSGAKSEKRQSSSVDEKPAAESTEEAPPSKETEVPVKQDMSEKDAAEFKEAEKGEEFESAQKASGEREEAQNTRTSTERGAGDTSDMDGSPAAQEAPPVDGSGAVQADADKPAEGAEVKQEAAGTQDVGSEGDAGSETKKSADAGMESQGTRDLKSEL